MNEETVTWIVCISILIASVLVFGFIIIDMLTRECIQYEDVCYKKVCSKGCWDRPISCSDEKAIGHKQMCIVSKSILWTKGYRD